MMDGDSRVSIHCVDSYPINNQEIPKTQIKTQFNSLHTAGLSIWDMRIVAHRMERSVRPQKQDKAGGHRHACLLQGSLKGTAEYPWNWWLSDSLQGLPAEQQDPREMKVLLTPIATKRLKCRSSPFPFPLQKKNPKQKEEDGIQTTTVKLTTTVNSTTSAVTPKAGSTSSSTNAASQTTQGTAKQPPAVTTAASTSLSTANTTQASVTQLAQNESLDAASTTGQSFPSTVSPERNTSASGTSGLPMSSPTNSTNPTSESPKSSSGNQTGSDISYSNIILPIVITLIVITLSVFSLVALYKMCQKKTPERQENGAEQAQSDKEGVKLLSVKTTSPETDVKQPVLSQYTGISHQSCVSMGNVEKLKLFTIRTLVLMTRF
ncbi:hypothetical protein IHE44_0013251 [Lamprotornis superbus]|uniref:Endomucin n=1 Tax=Lamprotornis superbus TaxID=245042 RepID=A0A835TRK0_9PASS|nr:hypothetical protein IHE44_0013251 [Lamprotornis superbus]